MPQNQVQNTNKGTPWASHETRGKEETGAGNLPSPDWIGRVPSIFSVRVMGDQEEVKK